MNETVNRGPDSLYDLRLQGLNWSLYTAAALKTLSTTAVVVELLRSDPDSYLISFYVGLLFFVYVMAFVKRLGFAVRATGLVVFLFFLGVSELWSYGIASMGSLFFLTSVIFAALLFGRRGGTGWLALTLGTYAAVAYAYAAGFVVIDSSQQEASLPSATPRPWSCAMCTE